MEMTPDNLDLAVAGKLIKPINLDYVPNLAKNIWPELVSPFYDVDSHYTVPYTCYATGIAWRNDKVSEDIAAMPQPWDIFWQSEAYKGKIALLSEERETIGMALLRKGHLDINTEDPALIDQAVADLKELYDICNIKIGDLQYQTIPEGTSLAQPGVVGRHDRRLHLLPAQGNARDGAVVLEGREGQGAGAERLLLDLLRRRRSPCSPTTSSTTCSTTASSYENFVDFNGYQPPLNEIDPAHARHGRGRAGEPRELCPHERRLRARLAAVHDADAKPGRSSGRTATRTSWPEEARGKPCTGAGSGPGSRSRASFG